MNRSIDKPGNLSGGQTSRSHLAPVPSKALGRSCFVSSLSSSSLSTALALPLSCFFGLGIIPLLGCNSNTQAPTATPQTILAQSTRVAAQGQLLPKAGIIRMAGVPGDRVAQILTKENSDVTANTPLLKFASFDIRKAELELAQQRREEAVKQLEAKRIEAEQLLAAAILQEEAAELQLDQAHSQQKLAQRATTPVKVAKQGLERTEALTKDPRTKSLVAQNQVDEKKIQVDQAENELERSQLLADSSVAAAQLARKQADQQVLSAQKSQELVEQSSPLGSIDKQIALIQLQQSQAMLIAPVDGTILRISARDGDSVGAAPLIEMADLSAMICHTEVHEVDVSKVKVGQSASASSPALPKPLTGKVIEVHSVVGMPQLRSTSPLARVDYRTILVTIELDAASSLIAKKFVQLQVDVTIDTAQ